MIYALNSVGNSLPSSALSPPKNKLPKLGKYFKLKKVKYSISSSRCYTEVVAFRNDHIRVLINEKNVFNFKI